MLTELKQLAKYVVLLQAMHSPTKDLLTALSRWLHAADTD